ncbi:MAG: head GIN domain-containing protein [Myxococcota bacterium]
MTDISFLAAALTLAPCKSFLASLVGLLALLTLSGCLEESLEPSGRSLRQTFDIEGFDSVAVGNAISVSLEQGSEFRVVAEVDENYAPYLRVRRLGRTLHLDLEPDRATEGGQLSVTVSMPELLSLRIDGSSSVTATGFRDPRSRSVELSGASELEFSEATAFEELELRLSGASSAYVEGTAERATLRGSGASQLRLERLVTARADIGLSGASSAAVHVEESLSYELSGASVLEYSGRPMVTEEQLSGASTVAHVLQ